MDISALSPSRVNTVKDCELKYFLSYHIRLPEAKASNIYGLKGSAVHESLEYYVNSLRVDRNPELAEELKGKTNADYVQVLKDYYAETELWKLDDREGMRGKKPKGWPHPVEKNCEVCPWASKDSICTIAKKPMKTVEGCPRPNFEDELEMADWTVKDEENSIFDNKIIEAEAEFNLEIGDGVKLRGIIDLVVESDEDTLEIIDYKSGNSTKSYNAALTDPQMRIYSMVAKILWPGYKTYVTSLYYIRKKRMVSCVFSEEDDKGTLKAVQKHWDKIKTNTNPYRPQRSFWLCNFCVGYDNCKKIVDNHTVKGRFVLPTISCNQATTSGKCWGSLMAENPDDVTHDNTHLMTYTCVGHRKLWKGGEYEEEPDGGTTIR
jgi:RecB family exonuclease